MKLSVAGVLRSGLKVPCFVVVCMGNGHFGSSAIFCVFEVADMV